MARAQLGDFLRNECGLKIFGCGHKELVLSTLFLSPHALITYRPVWCELIIALRVYFIGVPTPVPTSHRPYYYYYFIQP